MLSRVRSRKHKESYGYSSFSSSNLCVTCLCILAVMLRWVGDEAVQGAKAGNYFLCG